MQDKVEGSEFDVQKKLNFYEFGDVKSYHSGDEFQRYRIMLKGKKIAEFRNREDSGYRDFWATTKHVYSLKYFLKYDRNNHINKIMSIVRFDKKGKERICMDISEYQDRTNSLMFSSIVNDETFILSSWITGDMEKIEISVNDCSGD
jgi:hypothetical protein